LENTKRYPHSRANMAKYKTVNISGKLIERKDQASPIIEEHCNEKGYELAETIESGGTTVVLVFKKEDE
jgi:hypothetical protein